MNLETPRENLETDLTAWSLGPYHPALPGPMRIAMQLDGEIIVRSEIETGFTHKGLESCLEKSPWHSSMVYVDHLDPEAAVFGELAFCLAVEELGEIEVPPRAQAIRLILSELARISSHQRAMVAMAQAVGADTMVHYVLRDRERLLDLFELVSGARFSLNFLRFGGVAADVTDGFIERVVEVCDLIRYRLREYNDLFSFNQAFILRTRGLSPISLELARSCGVTGPNARASGLRRDLRKSRPYSGYGSLDFEIPLSGERGDAHDRFLFRLREISQSVEILAQLAERIPSGSYSTERVEKTFSPPVGEAYARVESPRGLLGCHLVSDGSTRPSRVQFRTPSQAALLALPALLEGVRVDDFPVVLASLDLSISEVDR